MGVTGYHDLRTHIGHKIVCVCYGKDNEDPYNVSVECDDCGLVLLDYDHPSVRRTPVGDEVEEDLGSMPWEESAEREVRSALDSARWDFEQKTVTVESEDSKGPSGTHREKSIFQTPESLVEFLEEVYENAWNAEVPFDGGEPVFETESADEVASILADYREQLEKMGW